MNESIIKASEIVGSESKLARAIGVTQSAVNQWAKGVRPVPSRRAVAIELVTRGAVTRKDLFPDTWAQIWPELDKPSAQQAEQAHSI